MNYIRIYNNIIQKAMSRVVLEETYYEKHHIEPKCISRNNNADNLVKLTAKEHFICHKLLCKIYKNTEHEAKLLHALLGMCRSWYSKYHKRARYNKITAATYETLRNRLYGKEGLLKGANSPIYGRKHSKESIELMREKVKLSWLSGSRKSVNYRKPHSEETKLKMSLYRKNKKVGKDNPNAKKCCIDGVIYDSVADAGKALGVKPNTIQRRIYSFSAKFKQYYYLQDLL